MILLEILGQHLTYHSPSISPRKHSITKFNFLAILLRKRYSKLNIPTEAISSDECHCVDALWAYVGSHKSAARYKSRKIKLAEPWLLQTARLLLQINIDIKRDTIYHTWQTHQKQCSVAHNRKPSGCCLEGESVTAVYLDEARVRWGRTEGIQQAWQGCSEGVFMATQWKQCKFFRWLYGF